MKKEIDNWRDGLSDDARRYLLIVFGLVCWATVTTLAWIAFPTLWIVISIIEGIIFLAMGIHVYKTRDKL